jgi:hypothetical protein
MYYVAKFLQAAGITSLLIGLVLGLQGNMAAQYYYFFAGIGIFFVGWLILKTIEKRAKRGESTG